MCRFGYHWVKRVTVVIMVLLLVFLIRQHVKDTVVIKRLINPFNEVAEYNINYIMNAYAFNDFGIGCQNLTVKRILFWNEAYGSKDYGIGFGDGGFTELNCPIARCWTTDDRNSMAMEDFDAIVFHLRTVQMDDLPQRRSVHQRYVFWSLESPQYNMQDMEPLNGLFNWTMTYRWDSDIVQPYGWVEPVGAFGVASKPQEVAEAVRVYRQGALPKTKRKMVAWFVSNCQSKSRREQYVEVLARYITVDIYGRCGPLRCDQINMERCYEMLQTDYKFYLSFENSMCDDYVTEKFLSVLRYDVVPIVFGGANYSKMAPPFSYIDARDFESARQLVDYLRRLDDDDELYNRYFWWKAHYRVRNHVTDLKLTMCGLCARLHVDDGARKVYDDLEKWWVRDSHCHVPRKDGVFRIPFWDS